MGEQFRVPYRRFCHISHTINQDNSEQTRDAENWTRNMKSRFQPQIRIISITALLLRWHEDEALSMLNNLIDAKDDT